MFAIRSAGIMWLLILVVGAGLSSAQAPRELVISFTPEADPIHLELNAPGLTAYLSAELGMPVTAKVDADYAATVEAMRAGHAHIATNLSPLQAALAHRIAGAQVILAEERDGRAYYHARFWVRKNDGISSLEELRGKTVAFNDPLSGSGYLMPVGRLIAEGLIERGDDVHRFFGGVYFAGGTELSIRALVNGFVDVAAVSENAAAVFLSPQERDLVTFVAESEPMPRHAIAVSRNLPADLVTRIEQAFLKLNEPEHNHILQGLYGWRTVVPAHIDLYLPLVDLAQRVGILD